jgi:hypothetical protein
MQKQESFQEGGAVIGFGWWQKWLVVAGCVVTAFGVFMALANATPLFHLFNQQIDPVFWDQAALTPETIAFRTWVYGAWGATVAGWGIFIVFIAARPFRERRAWAWWCLLLGVGVWYLLDSGLSWRSGVLFNVAFNTILLAAVGLPLVFTAPSFLRDV